MTSWAIVSSTGASAIPILCVLMTKSSPPSKNWKTLRSTMPARFPGIRAGRRRLGTAIPSIAVFDTGFHRTIPERARFYAIPWELTLRHEIRRYGFHGISHNYLLLRYAELTGTPLEQTNIVTF